MIQDNNPMKIFSATACLRRGWGLGEGVMDINDLKLFLKRGMPIVVMNLPD